MRRSFTPDGKQLLPKPIAAEPPSFLFDLYGTLIDIQTDEESEHFWRAIADYLGTDDAPCVKARYRSLCEEAAGKLPPRGEADLLPVFSALLEAYGVFGSAAAFATYFRTASTVRLKLFPRRKTLLRGLRARGAKLYLLSNAQACFTYSELFSFGLEAYFDGILLSSEAGCKKPAREFFETALARFSLTAKNCVYVGNDLVDDVGGARAAGLRSVYIQTEQSGVYPDPPPADMRATQATLAMLLYRIAEGKETL